MVSVRNGAATCDSRLSCVAERRRGRMPQRAQAGDDVRSIQTATFTPKPQNVPADRRAASNGAATRTKRVARTAARPYEACRVR